MPLTREEDGMTRAEKRGYWEEQVAGKRASGMSVAGYCRQQGLKEWQFYAWQRRLGAKGTGRVERPGEGFVPIRLVEGGLTVRLARGVEIEAAAGCPADLFVAALSAVRGSWRCWR